MSKNVKIDLDHKKIMKKINAIAEEKATSIQAEREYQSRIHKASSHFADPQSGIIYKRVDDLD